jgi:hypothetical protein
MFRFHLYLIRMEPSLWPINSKGRRDTKYQPFHRKINLLQFKGGHNRAFRRKFAACLVNRILLERRVYGPTKITDFEHIETVEYVLGLKIPMYNIVAVQIANSTNNLSKIEGSKVLLEVIFLSDFLKETAVCYQLQKQVNFISIMKKSVHF